MFRPSGPGVSLPGCESGRRYQGHQTGRLSILLSPGPLFPHMSVKRKLMILAIVLVAAVKINRIRRGKASD